MKPILNLYPNTYEDFCLLEQKRLKGKKIKSGETTVTRSSGKTATYYNEKYRTYFKKMIFSNHYSESLEPLNQLYQNIMTAHECCKILDITSPDKFSTLFFIEPQSIEGRYFETELRTHIYTVTKAVEGSSVKDFVFDSQIDANVRKSVDESVKCEGIEKGLLLRDSDRRAMNMTLVSHLENDIQFGHFDLDRALEIEDRPDIVTMYTYFESIEYGFSRQKAFNSVMRAKGTLLEKKDKLPKAFNANMSLILIKEAEKFVRNHDRFSGPTI